MRGPILATVRFVTRRRVLLRVLMPAVVALLATTMLPAVASARPIGPFDVGGSILVEYDRLASMGRSPGTPTIKESDAAGGGKFQDFQNNNHIYWIARVDPGRGRQVGGFIYDKWKELNWEKGPLGYPITSEENAANGGKFSVFEGGSVYWTLNTKAHPIFGQIFQTWKANGYERSPYGYPVSDEETIGDGKRQKFQNGQYIEWHPEGFPEDYEGDTFQDDDPDNNNDSYYPTCSDGCADDATVELRGGPEVNSTGATNPSGRSTIPQSTTGVTDGGQFCDEVKPDPTAKPGDKLLCVVRDGAEPERSIDADRRGVLPPTSAPDTQTPSQAPSSSATEQSPPSSAPTSTDPTKTTPETTTETTEEPSTPHEDEVPSSSSPSSESTPRRNIAVQPAAIGGAPPLVGDEKYCDSYSSDFKLDRWLGDRDFQCRTKIIKIQPMDKKSGFPIGIIFLRESRNVKLAWNNTAWTENAGIFVQFVQPDPAFANAELVLNSVNITYNYSCFYPVLPCYNDGGSTPTMTGSVPALQIASSQTQFRRGAFAPPGGKNETQSQYTFTATLPDYELNGFTGYTPPIRCDAGAGLRSQTGCAFTSVTPKLAYYKFGNIGEFLTHVRSAQESGLPGSLDSDTTLERVTSKSTIRANRRGTCGGVTGPRNNGKSCDEYPFASTDQGGRSGGPYSNGQVRSFVPPCNIRDADLTSAGSRNTGYSVCLIDRGQNSRAGSILAWFYAKNRVMDGDSFHVNVVAPS